MTMIQTDKTGKPVETTISWIVAILTAGYMLPWAIAASRGKSNALAIGMVNFFLGWTIIGWIIALVMACGSHQVAAVPQVVVQTSNYLNTGTHMGPQHAMPAVMVQPSPPLQITPAGWYSTDGGMRWWDGAGWTDHFQSPASAAPAPLAPPDPDAPAATVVQNEVPRPLLEGPATEA